MSITLPIALDSAVISQHEAATNRVVLDRTEQNPAEDGLVLVSGNGVADGLAYTPFSGASVTIDALEGYAPTTLTSALFSNLHLVKGEVLTIKSEYDFKDETFNDFAFALIKRVGDATANGYLIADGNSYNSHGVGTLYTTTININVSGTYNLLLASSDAGDIRQASNFLVHSIAYTIPDEGANAFTLTPNGIRLVDGSQLLANGDGVLPSGVGQTGILSAGSQALLSALISQDGGGVVSHDAGGIVSHDAGGIVSHDAGGIVSHDAGGIVSHDAGGIVSHDAGGLITQDGGSIVSHDAGGLISQDGGGIVATGGGNLHLSFNAYKGLADQTALEASRPATFTPTITLQAATIIGADHLVGELFPSVSQQADPAVAALPNGKYVVVWSDNLAGTGSFEIRAQLRSADGAPVGSSFVVSTETGSDQVTPSVTALANGQFVVAWRGPGQSNADIHTQLYDAAGAKIGSETRVGYSSLSETLPHVSSTTDGGYVLVFEERQLAGGSTTSALGYRYDSNGAYVAALTVGATTSGTDTFGAVATGLHDGGVAVAYAEKNSAQSDQDGIYLDIISSGNTTTHAQVHVNSTVLGVQSTPTIATLANGNVVVAWIDGGPGNGPDVSTLRAQILDPTGALVGSEIRIADTLKGGDAPAIVALADGRFTVSWDSPVITNAAVVGLNVHAQIFSQDGLTATPVFEVTTQSVDNAYRVGMPAAAQLTNGTLAFVSQLTETGGNSTIHTDLFAVGAPSAPPSTTSAGPPTSVTFDKLTDNAGGSFSKVVAAADVNVDGKLDLVTLENGSINVLLGDGHGAFARQSPIAVDGQPSTLSLVDVNGDGKLDIVTGGFGDQIARSFIGQGNGTFTPVAQTTFFPTDRFVGLDVADITGDGRPDIIQAGNNGYSIAAGNGDGTFQTPVLTRTASVLDHAVTADLNGDGKLDVVTTQPNANSITVSVSQSNGSFSAPVDISVGTSPFTAVLADIDGDGHPDIVVNTNNGNVPSDDNIVVIPGHGDGSFGAPITTALGRATASFAVGDLNGDGHLDVVTANQGYDSNSHYTATVLLGQGDGTFVVQGPLITGSDPDSVVITDVDGDGKLDVVTANFSDGSVSIFLNSTVIAPAITSAPGASTPMAAGSNAGAGTHDVSFLDGQGRPVIDTLDSSNRLVREVVKDATSGNVLSTVALTYSSNGTYTQHSDVVTTAGSLTVDAVYGPKGELSETSRDQGGNLISTATVTYNDDGSVARHTTAAGQTGSDDFIYSTALGSPNGGFVAHTHNDASGHVTAYDVNGQVVVTPPAAQAVIPAGLTGPYTINATNVVSHYGKVEASSDGSYFVTWTDSTNSSLNAQKIGSSGAIITPIVNLGQIPSSYDTAVTADGLLHVATITNNNIIVSNYDVNLSSASVDQVYSGGLTPSNVSLASFSDNSKLVAYSLDPNSGSTRYLGDTYVSSNGSTVSHTIPTTASMADLPAISALDDGNKVVVFKDGASLYFSILDHADNAVRGASLIADNNSFVSNPDVAALHTGGFVVTWTSGTTASADIHATVYDKDGNVVHSDGGHGLTVNTTVFGGQLNSHVTSLADGGFLVTWDDLGAVNEKAQRFDSSGNHIGQELTLMNLQPDTSSAGARESSVATLADGRTAYSHDDNTSGAIINEILETRTNVSGHGTGHDLFGDGSADQLILRTSAASGGSLTMFDLNPTGGLTQIGFVGADWSVAGSGDLNGHGRSDLIMQHDVGSSRDIYSFTMGATQVTAITKIGAIGLDWQIDGAGDFNGDGFKDILLERFVNNTKELDVLGVKNGAVTSVHVAGVLQPGFQVDGIGDMNKDGKADILVHSDDAAGRHFYEIDEANYTAQAVKAVATIGVEWQALGLGDINGDGYSDILITRDTVSARDIGLLVHQGETFVFKDLGPIVGKNVQIDGIGDFNGDGTADISAHYDMSGTTRADIYFEMHNSAITDIHSTGSIGHEWIVT